MDDHAAAIIHVLEQGENGNRYCVGTNKTFENIVIVNKIIKVLGLDDSAIEYVEDRKGHDPKYALDCAILNSIGWQPKREFEEALDETITWYRDNRAWWQYFVDTYDRLGMPDKL